MKKSIVKIVLSLLLTWVHFGACAQESKEDEMQPFQERKGNFLLGYSFGFTLANNTGENTSENDSETITLSTVATAGYFITDRSAVGLSLDYNFSNTDFDGGSLKYNDNNNLVFSPFFRSYLIKDAGLFLQGQVNVGTSNAKSEYLYQDSEGNNVSTVVKNEYNLFGFTGAIGYDIPIKENIFFEPSVQYSFNNLNDKNGDNDLDRKLLYLTVGIFIEL